MKDAKTNPPTEAGYWNVSYPNISSAAAMHEYFDGVKWANNPKAGQMFWWEGTRRDDNPNIR